jgi:hypothetical protein
MKPVPKELVNKIESLKKRNPTSYKRPSSCPLQISKHLDILTKLESIKLLFENTCFSDFEDQFNAILDGARDLEDSLNKSISTATNGETTTSVSSLSDLENSDKVLSYRSLGTLMLKANGAKKKAEVLQALIEQYDCLNITNDSE